MNPPAGATDLEQWIEQRVRIGFDAERDIIEQAEDIFPEAEGVTIERALGAAIARRQERLAGVGPTDCDRLDQAFAALDRAGVLTRQNFTCCNNCGHAEIWDPIAEAEARGQQLEGFAFYHRQDAEGVASAEGKGLLYLSFGAVDSDEDDDAERIGRTISAALSAEGLETVWDGKASRRIGVKLEWKRRPQELAPLAVVPAPSAAEVLARWCAHFPRVSAASLAQSAPPFFAELLLSLGEIDAAGAWARAAGDQAALLAVARHRPEHYALALRQIPRQDRAEVGATAPPGAFQLLELMLRGGLDDPRTRRAIEARVRRLDRGLPREMAHAWLAVIQGDYRPISEPERRAFVEERWQSAQQQRSERHEEDSARAALGAAIWVLLGDSSAGDRSLGWLAELGSSLTPPSVIGAVLAAARVHRASERLLPAAQLLPGLRSRVVADLVSSGRLAEAVAAIEAANVFEQGRLWSQLARLTGSAEWLARARSGEDPQELFQDGVITQAELDEIILEGLWAEAMAGDRSAAALGVRAWVDQRAERLLETGAAVSRWLADGARSSVPPLPLPAAPAPEELDQAVQVWEETGSSWLEKRRARRAVHKILDAVIALAKTEGAWRGRALLALVLERWDPVHDGLGDAVVLALLQHEQLSQAWATERRLSEAGRCYPAATAALAIALAPVQLSDARSAVHAALPHARTKMEAALLAPAVLAVQAPSERAAAASALRAAWSQADVEIDQLRIR